MRGLLIEDGRAVAADQAPWWPELLRMRRDTSIRALARHFDTEPRRIRRGLARVALRVGGRDLEEGEGAARLSAYSDMLGKERDRAIAKAAGVIPEAVQGERRRLDIGSYRQRARIRLSRDDEEWIRGPRKTRRERFRPEPETLQVVRRPTRSLDPSPMRDIPPLSIDRMPWQRSDQAPSAPEPAFRRTPSVSPGDFYAESRRRDFYRGERENEIDRLLQPTRQHRDGRMRIVRSEPARPPIEEAAPLGVIRRREPAREPEVVTAAPRPTTRRVAAPAEPVRRTVVAPAVRPPPPPMTVRRAPRAESAVPAIQPEVVVAPHVPEVPTIEWLVYVPGRDEPLRVRAADIASAASIAATMVPAGLLARASIWRADAEAPAPELL